MKKISSARRSAIRAIGAFDTMIARIRDGNPRAIESARNLIAEFAMDGTPKFLISVLSTLAQNAANDAEHEPE